MAEFTIKDKKRIIKVVRSFKTPDITSLEAMKAALLVGKITQKEFTWIKWEFMNFQFISIMINPETAKEYIRDQLKNQESDNDNKIKYEGVDN